MAHQVQGIYGLHRADQREDILERVYCGPGATDSNNDPRWLGVLWDQISNTANQTFRLVCPQEVEIERKVSYSRRPEAR